RRLATEHGKVATLQSVDREQLSQTDCDLTIATFVFLVCVVWVDQASCAIILKVGAAGTNYILNVGFKA
ncbi:MAG: hypothetical protein ACRCYD_16220, partial [Plesiomonas sp.]